MKNTHTARSGRRRRTGQTSGGKLKHPPHRKQHDRVAEIRQTMAQALERRQESIQQELLAWHRRPRIHLSTLKLDDLTAELDPQHTDELVQVLGSTERLALFRKLADDYRKHPTLENYLRLRRDISEAEIHVGLFGGLDPLFALEQRLVEHGIDPALVAGAMDAYEPDIDELSLQLMERLVIRNKLSKAGPGAIKQRREAISDTLVYYLIVVMLEAVEWNKDNPIVIPSSLIVLIRDYLCGPEPDLRKEWKSWEARRSAASYAAQVFPPGQKIPVRKLAEGMDVGKGTAERWLADPEFQRSIEFYRKLYAGETTFGRLRKELPKSAPDQK